MNYTLFLKFHFLTMSTVISKKDGRILNNLGISFRVASTVFSFHNFESVMAQHPRIQRLAGKSIKYIVHPHYFVGLRDVSEFFIQD